MRILRPCHVAVSARGRLVCGSLASDIAKIIMALSGAVKEPIKSRENHNL